MSLLAGWQEDLSSSDWNQSDKSPESMYKSQLNTFRTIENLSESIFSSSSSSTSSSQGQFISKGLDMPHNSAKYIESFNRLTFAPEHLASDVGDPFPFEEWVMAPQVMDNDVFDSMRSCTTFKGHDDCDFGGPDFSDDGRAFSLEDSSIESNKCRSAAIKNQTRRHSTSSISHIYCCPQDGCDKSFTRFYNLRSHYRSHSGDRPFTCTLCDQSFARNHDLKRHQKIHSGNKPFQCTHCRKSFSRQDAQSRHFRLKNCQADTGANNDQSDEEH